MLIVRTLFGLEAPVGRRLYALVGFSLMFVKYGLDAAIFRILAGKEWLPWDYLSPLLATRTDRMLDGDQTWLLATLALTTLPFLWIGAAMTLRRALDAGLSPWLALFFFVPLANYLAMIILCLLPSHQPTQDQTATPPDPPQPAQRVFFEALSGALLCGLVLIIMSVYFFESYGGALFLGAPFIVGVVAAMLLNRGSAAAARRGSAHGIAQIAILVCGLSILLFALEGVICLAMAWPLGAVLAAMGAEFGWQIARLRQSRNLEAIATLLLAWPFLAAFDARFDQPQTRVVETRRVIAAAPENVWPNVIGFSELPAPQEWLFGLGFAYPLRARIEGEGVGAVRYCEFSTGPFVEPITVWEPPHRLAFDVAAQPPAMKELSPYRHIEPPHLDGFLKSRRGEFRLLPLTDGRTELVGTTEYEVLIFPNAYWQLYSDAIIHAIHERVLRHIATLSEDRA